MDSNKRATSNNSSRVGHRDGPGDLQGARPGVFNYMAPEAQSSLYRNGQVYTKRDIDGSDGGSFGINTQAYNVQVQDARLFAGEHKKTCEINGFELLDAPMSQPRLDFFDHDVVVGSYYKECEELVAAATGGQAFAFDHNVRSALGKQSKKRITGGQQVQGPAKIVHGDYTLYSAPQRLRDLSNPPNVNDTLRSVLPEGASLVSAQQAEAGLSSGGRFGIINVWRNIAAEPVMTDPLAMCDSQSVRPEDLVTFEIHYHDRIGENYFAKHADRHSFFFFPEMTRDEAMLLKQWDSDGALAQTDGVEGDSTRPNSPSTFSFHSAFDDPSSPDDAPDRWSIEVRCLVLY